MHTTSPAFRISPPEAEMYAISTVFAWRVAKGSATDDEVRFMNAYLGKGVPASIEEMDEEERIMIGSALRGDGDA